MNYRTAGFADELTKLGFLKTLGKAALVPAKWAVKNPMTAIGAGFVAIPPILAARQAYKETASGRGGSGYLRAGKDEYGRIRPSESAYANWHGLLPHKPSAKQIKALSKYYDSRMF